MNGEIKDVSLCAVMSSIMVFTRVHKNAQAPMQATKGSAGMDLSAVEAKVIPARGRGVVSTGLKLSFANNCYGQIASRSGLAVKHGIVVGAGVIDSDYRGIVGVVLFNHSDTDFQVKVGDRIAQLLVISVAQGNPLEISERKYNECLVDTKNEHLEQQQQRGAGGFGSTGVSLVDYPLAATAAPTVAPSVAAAAATTHTVSDPVITMEEVFAGLQRQWNKNKSK